MAIGDIVRNVVNEVLAEILKKATGTNRRRRRRKSLTPSERLRKIENLLKPARRQTSRKKTGRTRSTTQRRRVRTKTRTHRRSLRRGSSTR